MGGGERSFWRVWLTQLCSIHVRGGSREGYTPSKKVPLSTNTYPPCYLRSFCKCLVLVNLQFALQLFLMHRVETEQLDLQAGRNRHFYVPECRNRKFIIVFRSLFATCNLDAFIYGNISIIKRGFEHKTRDNFVTRPHQIDSVEFFRLLIL